MPSLPQWVKDPHSHIPQKYQTWLEQVGDCRIDIRSGRLLKKDFEVLVRERLGQGGGVSHVLYYIMRTNNETSGNDDLQIPRQGGKPERLPSLRSWDREAEIFAEGLSWDHPQADSVKDLIQRRTAVFRDKYERKKREKITNVRVRMNGPIAITHLGDPHVDADGCNWPELIKAVETISKTEGMYAGNIGDTTNNWVGSLQRLYADQSSTFEEGVRLAEWLLTSVPWLYVILGNHDSWNNGSTLVKQILRRGSVATCTAGTARIELTFPKGDPIRIMARHDFKGSSSWNRIHGPMKAAKLDPWADIYVSGHKHHWAQHIHEGMDGKPRYSMTVRGYKYCDAYADAGGWYDHDLGSSCTTILNPTATNKTERVRCIWDVEEAAEYLRWIRRRQGYST